jgi:hypothetical protein
MRRENSVDMVDKTAKVFLAIGQQLVPLRLEYNSADMAEQVLYMLTVFKTMPVGMDDAAMVPVKARMVELLEEARVS